MLTQFGTPYERQIGSPEGILMLRDHSYASVRMLEGVSPKDTVEFVAWRRECLCRVTGEMVGVFDPATGAIRETGGRRLLQVYQVMR